MRILASAIFLLGTALFTGNAQAQALETVKIANIGHAYWAGPLYIAQQYNLFEKHGVKAEVTEVKGGSIAFQAALTKSSDLAQVTFEHVLKAASKGQRVESFYRFGKAPANNIIANNEIMSRAKGKSVEERIRALKGARVAIPSAGGSNEKMLEMLATVYGLDMNTVQRLYLGGEPGSYVAAFKTNQIDAAVYAEPVGLLVEKGNLGGTLLNVISGEEPRFNDIIFLTLVAHPDVIAQKAGLLKKVSAAYDDALKLMHDEPEKGIAAMAKEFPRLSAEENASIYKAMLPTWPRDGKMNLEQANRTISYMTALGELETKSSFDPATLFTNRLQQ